MPSSGRVGWMPPEATEEDGGLRALLARLDPKARDTLRRILIHDQANRDAVASDLLRHRDGRGEDWADMIDMLTMDLRWV
jgi:hypothetical protein